jgi:hypothetical protein
MRRVPFVQEALDSDKLVSFRRNSAPRAPRAALLCAALLAPACNRDWDAFDPRLGVASPAGAGGTSSSSSTGMGGASSSSSSASGVGGGGGAGGGGVVMVSIPPTVAACINPMALDPAACELQASDGMPGLMDVDSDPVDLAANFTSYIRFDITDPALAGKTIDEVTLRLVVGMGAYSDSSQTGELWEVTPFTFDALSKAAPIKINKRGDNQGAAVPGQVVAWPLAPALLASGAVYLGLYPVNPDGVDYWNKNGKEPPALLVAAH